MKERKSTTIKKQRAITELIAAYGNVTIACEKAGIVRSTFYKWQEEDAQFADKVEKVIRGVHRCAQDRILLLSMQNNLDPWKLILKATTSKLKNRKINA